MVLALRGWFDIAEVATTAINELSDRSGRTDRRLDRSRPVLRLHAGTTLRRARRRRDAPHPLADQRVPLRPLPRMLRTIWSCSPGSSRTCATRRSPSACSRSPQQSKCEVVVTVGAVADTIPHTRPPLVVGSTTNRSLLTRARAVAAALPGHHRSRRRAAGASRSGRHPRRFAARRRPALPRQRPASAVVDRSAATPPPRARCSRAHRPPGHRGGTPPSAARRGGGRRRAGQRLRGNARARVRPALGGGDSIGRRSRRRVRTVPPRPAPTTRTKAHATISRHSYGMLFKQNPWSVAGRSSTHRSRPTPTAARRRARDGSSTGAARSLSARCTRSITCATADGRTPTPAPEVWRWRSARSSAARRSPSHAACR